MLYFRNVERILIILFSSIIFLWIFLPAVLIVNALLSVIPFGSNDIRIRAKNIFLLISSLIFYAWGGIRYLLIMLAVILINYLAGLIMDRSGRYRKVVFVAALIANLGILFFFKHFNLLTDTIEYLRAQNRAQWDL